jgi:hypothetical protein
VAQGITTRQAFRGSEEPGIVVTEGMGTGPPLYWSGLVGEADVRISQNFLLAYLEKCDTFLRAHREIWPSVLTLTGADTWGDVEIRGLRTLLIKSRGVRQEVPIRLIPPWNQLLSHDPVTHEFRSDPSVWFYCEDPEPTVASEDKYPEWEWIQANEARLREKYAGLWIAVAENGMVAVAGSEVEVLKQANKIGHENVFTFYVPTESEPAVVVVAA